MKIDTMGPDETWVGNVEATEVPADIRHIRSARLGGVAYDIHDARLDERFRPLFIGRNDMGEYDRVRMAELGRIMDGTVRK